MSFEDYLTFAFHDTDNVGTDLIRMCFGGIMLRAISFLLIFSPFLTGCFIFPAYEPPSETVTGIQWSSDGSTVFAFRTKPVDSGGYTHDQYYIDSYDRSGTRLTSTRADRGLIVPVTITEDGAHIIFSNYDTLMFGTLSDSSLKYISGHTLNAISPSGHLALSSIDNGSGLDGRAITYFLIWFDAGTARVIRQWQTRATQGSPPSIITDSLFTLPESINGSDYFSVYDTMLNLLYREPVPSKGMRGLGYAASIHSILVVKNWDGPSGIVELIDVATGKDQQVLDWPGNLSAAPDGYHVVYGYPDVRIRNLLTNNEKDIAPDSPDFQLFSPDEQVVAYVPLNNVTVVKCVPVNGLP